MPVAITVTNPDGKVASLVTGYTYVPGPPPPPVPPGSHGYFNLLVARPDHWVSASLRTPAQLASRLAGGYAQGSLTAPLNVTYDVVVDAAKIVIPATTNSLPNQLRIPMGTTDGHSYFITWDVLFGAEFAFTNTGINNYKTWQFDSARLVGGVATIWTEINSNFGGSPATAGLVRGRYYNTALTPAGPGVILPGPGIPSLGPQLAQFTVQPNAWTRYFVRFDQKVGGDSWTRFSLWVADTTHDPVQIFDRLAFTVLGGIQKFWIEYNTSTDAVAPGRGPLTSYIRNVAMLRDMASLPPMPRP